MNKLDDRIKEFWENKTTPGQRREILRQLEESGLEWQEFMRRYYNKVLSGEETSSLTDAQQSRVWQRLHDQHLASAVPQLARTRIAWLPWMAAASVILIVGLFIFSQNKSIPKDIAAFSKTIIKKNVSSKDDSLILPDHSVVLLASGSSIRYPENFEAASRNIALEGKALFEVAKDSLRPFTVTAHGLATTALGTRFIVDATTHKVSIHLLKGKIVVNAAPQSGMALQKIYLTPGQELKVDIEANHFALNNPQPLTVAVNTPAKRHRPKPFATADAINPLIFESTDLAAVFQRLGEYYKTPILYDKAEVQGMSFTGEFKSSDELDLALKVICNMNRLSFTKVNDHIVINKQQ